MRFTILREIFLKHLRAVGGAVEKRQSQALPILANILIRVSNVDNRFSLTATDQEVELIAGGEVEPGEDVLSGAITVPFRKLMDVCKALPDGIQLTLHLEGERVIIRAGHSRFALSTLSADQFPNVEESPNAFPLVISQKALRTLIDSTSFAMAEQDVRYYLNGMLLEIKMSATGCFLYAVAADGHRLAERSMELIFNPQAVRVIVPRKGVLELQRALQEVDEEVALLIGANHIRVVTDVLTLTCKLLSGRFPDYERLIPKEGTHTIVGQRLLLKNAFLRASALFSEKFRGVKLVLTPGRLKILATNTECDDVEEDVEVEYTGEALEVGFNVRYLIDFLNIIQTDTVRFTFSGQNSSTRIEGVGADTGVYVIMPMRI